MKLSIIVPVYNTEEYLPRCVDSLLAQDLNDCEILLVDDGSTDEKSGQLCDAFAARYPDVIRVIHKPNGGLGDARNVGIKAALGEYLLFVDSDDYIAQNTVATLAPWMKQGIDVVVFGFMMDIDGTFLPFDIGKQPYGRKVKLTEMPELLLSTPSACNKLWRRTLFTENKILFPVRIWYEDLATTAKLYACANHITAITDKLYFYMIREGSIMRNADTARILEIIDAICEIVEWYKEHGLFRQYIRELESITVENVLLDASIRVLKAGSGDQATKQCDQNQILEALRTFTDQTFPEWHTNPYLKKDTWKRRLILTLLKRRQYALIKWVFVLASKDRY